MEFDNSTGIIKHDGVIRNPLTFYTFTSTSNVNINPLATALAIGSSQTMYIPTVGRIYIAGVRAVTDATAAAANISMRLAFKIGATTYEYTRQTDPNSDDVQVITPGAYHGTGSDIITAGNVGYTSFSFQSNGVNYTYGATIEDWVARNSFPTGDQTVSLVCYEPEGDTGGVLAGATRETVVTIGIEDWT